MECYYHPNRESTDTCAICGKSICKECGLEIAGKVYCKDCLEKIIGINMNNNAQQEAPKPEPVRVEKQAPVENQIQMEELTKQPEEVHFSNQKIADDSPYNIKDNIQYEGGIESTYDANNQPKVSLHDAIENNQIPQQPVQDVRKEYVQQAPIMEEVVREPVQQARNEYDYQRPQAQPSQDYIYPDHSYQPEETHARQAVEDKYEKYLDDLYFDEEEVPLNEQLARDEAQYGSLTRNEYKPRNTYEQKTAEDDDLDRRIREELARREQDKKHSIRNRGESIHNIKYEEEKEPYSAVDILLTIVLVLVIIIVVFYIIYIFKLSATYPTFMDAIFGLKNPGQFINALTH